MWDLLMLLLLFLMLTTILAVRNSVSYFATPHKLGVALVNLAEETKREEVPRSWLGSFVPTYHT